MKRAPRCSTSRRIGQEIKMNKKANKEIKLTHDGVNYTLRHPIAKAIGTCFPDGDSVFMVVRGVGGLGFRV